MKHLIRVLPVLCVLTISSAHAQNIWQVYARSPFGTVYQICSTGPTSMLIATDSGLFYTTDNAQTWTRTIAPSIPLPVINGNGSSAYFLRTQNVIIAAGSNGFDRSTDGGITWNTVSVVGGKHVVNGALPISFGNNLYIEASDSSYPYNFQIYRSTDLGSSWTLLNPKLTPIQQSFLLCRH